MKHTLVILAIAIIPTCLYAVDGQVLINQATVIAAGGFPYTITQPGSYKLSGNLVVTGSTDGIDINSDNVTLDLNGFTMTGPVVCSGTRPTCSGTAGDGIKSTNDHITVKNGAIRGFAYGVSLFGSNGPLLTDLIASGNSQFGFLVVGSGVIARCETDGNAAFGMSVTGMTVSDSAASHNGNDGFFISGSSLFNSQASSNGGFGINSSSGLYGNNVLFSNRFPDVNGGGSQGNNLCGGGLC